MRAPKLTGRRHGDSGSPSFLPWSLSVPVPLPTWISAGAGRWYHTRAERLEMQCNPARERRRNHLLKVFRGFLGRLPYASGGTIELLGHAASTRLEAIALRRKATAIQMQRFSVCCKAYSLKLESRVGVGVITVD